MDINTIRGHVDFGIITIREDEFRAVLQRFPPESVVQGNRIYALSHVQTIQSDSYLVAITRCVEQGTGEGQAVAQDLIRDLDPQWLVVVGIAGAVPDFEFTLGDVVAATRLHDFCVEAVIEGGAPEYAVTGGPMHRAVQDILAILPVWDKKLQGWNNESSIGMPRPPIDLNPDNFYGDEKWQEKSRKTLGQQLNVSRKPIVVTGPIVSSDRLVKDSELVKAWKQAARHTRAVEMELAGVYRAARQKDREYPILAIRGISDIVGFKRHPDWTRYACHSAAAFAYAFIKARPIKPRYTNQVKNINLSHLIANTPQKYGWSSTNVALFISLESTQSIRTRLQTPDGQKFGGLLPFDHSEVTKIITEFPKLAYRYSEEYVQEYTLTSGNELYNMTISPPVREALESLLTPSTIELVIEPNLQCLPWELMHDGKEFLCLKHSLGRSIASSDDLRNLKSKIADLDSPIGGLKFLLISMTGLDYDSEVRLIFDMCQQNPDIDTSILSREQATRHQFLNQLYRGQSIVHLAGHASGSGVLLYDGILDMDLIAETALQHHPPRLITLSACETGLVENTETEPTGYRLASRGFNVLSPLTWIGFELSQVIATSFYKDILNGKSFGESLRLAKNKAFPTTVGWWSYILYGNPSESLTSNRNKEAC